MHISTGLLLAIGLVGEELLYIQEFQEGAKMAEQKDVDLTSCHAHTKITTTYRATIYEGDLKTGRK